MEKILVILLSLTVIAAAKPGYISFGSQGSYDKKEEYSGSKQIQSGIGFGASANKDIGSNQGAEGIQNQGIGGTGTYEYGASKGISHNLEFNQGAVGIENQGIGGSLEYGASKGINSKQEFSGSQSLGGNQNVGAGQDIKSFQSLSGRQELEASEELRRSQRVGSKLEYSGSQSIGASHGPGGFSANLGTSI